MNFKRKAGYKMKRSCGLCKPWKRVGNSGHADNHHHLLKRPDVDEQVNDLVTTDPDDNKSVQ